MNTNTFAIMWDCYGLESVVNVSEIGRKRTWATLKDQDTKSLPQLPNLNHWALRARYNPQRNYEIYIFEADKTMSREDIIQAFDDHPQHMADTIRRVGTKFYIDRADKQERKIV